MQDAMIYFFSFFFLFFLFFSFLQMMIICERVRCNAMLGGQGGDARKEGVCKRDK